MDPISASKMYCQNSKVCFIIIKTKPRVHCKNCEKAAKYLIAILDEKENITQANLFPLPDPPT